MIKTTTKSIFKLLTLGSAFLLASASANAQVSLTTIGSPYTQDFNTLSNSAAAPGVALAITGWYLNETGTNANQNYVASTGSLTAGDVYSFGAAAATERALGGIASGSLNPSFGASFMNNTGATVTSLDISYIGEEWRLGTVARQDSLVFQYSLDATSPTTGTWINVTSLNFKTPSIAGPTGAMNGNGAGNNTALSKSITGLSIANGSTVWVRWNDVNASGADDGLSIDDFSLTPQGVVVPILNVSDVSLNEGNAGTTSFDFVVSLSSPAGAGGVDFNISTADGSATNPLDYLSNTMTNQTIPVGVSTYTFSVLVNGDVSPESNTNFFVNVVINSGANPGDVQGMGTIVNDDYIIPFVTGDPQPQTVCNGSAANFSSTASGAPIPTVQWQVSTDGGANWSNISGATSMTYSLTATGAENGNLYWAIYTNGGGADTTASAALTVNPTYSIPQAVSICSGASVVFPDGSTQNNVTTPVVHNNMFATTLGCDSIIVTSVSINPVYNINKTAVVCPGNDYTYPDGTMDLNITGTVSHTSNLATLMGCDSIINTTVNVSPLDTTTASPQSICMGDSALFYGNYLTTAGMHYHILTNMFGCDSVIEIDLTVNPLPTPAYTSSVNVGTVDFASTFSFPSYAWDFGDGSPSNLTQSPSYTYAANGTYTVCLTVVDFNGCMDSVCAPVTIQSISLKELQHTTSISLYPNPAKDNFTIAFVSEVKTGTVKLINAIGQVVLTKEVKNASAVEFNLNAINKGVYFVQIENNGSKTVKRLIVE